MKALQRYQPHYPAALRTTLVHSHAVGPVVMATQWWRECRADVRVTQSVKRGRRSVSVWVCAQGCEQGRLCRADLSVPLWILAKRTLLNIPTTSVFLRACVRARARVCVVNQSLLASAISFQLGVSQTELTSISLHKVHHTSINKPCAAHYCCVISELDGANVQ